MNIAIVKGNLTRDPELKYTPKGTAVCSLSIAVNEVWNDDQGQKREKVHFFDVTAWGKRAETVNQYFHKGKPILVTGRLQQESWDEKETGQKRSKVKIVMDSFDFCGDTKAGDQRQRGGESAQPDADYDQPQDDAPIDGQDAPF
jgi:single-strand DNA-binding protein